MHLRTILRAATVIVLSAILSGCSDNQSPVGDHFTGQFTLTHADEQPLPAPVFDGVIDPAPSPTFRLRVVATTGSISIDADGHYQQHLEHDTYIDGVFNGRVIHADHGSCTRAAAQLLCESNYLEFVTFTATVSGTTLTIGQDIANEGHVATYRYDFSGN
jgi:hypothetical protein